MLGNIAFNTVMQCGELGPMQTLFHMVGCVIPEITRQQIEQSAGIVVRRFEFIIGMQATVVVIGDPRGKQQAGDHWQYKQE